MFLLFRTVRAFNDTDHGGRDRMGRWHAQAGQDRTVAKLLENQKGGFFLDLAANEPVVLSNTRTLERDYGFKGICIEVLLCDNVIMYHRIRPSCMKQEL